MRIAKRLTNKIILFMFYLLVINCSQHCYAGIEKYLSVDELGRQVIEVNGGISQPDIKEAEEIAKLLSENKVSCLYIRRFDFNYDGGEIWTTLLNILQKNHTLTKLDLSINGIGAPRAQALASALLVNQTLTQLKLSVNNIGSEGAYEIADALRVNHTLTQLNLEHNDIGHVGAQAIAGALRVNQTLTQLNLRDNHYVGTVGAQAIADALRVNQTLTQLDLRGNSTGDAGAQAIADALRINQTLTQLVLTYNGIGYVGAQAIADALQVNQTLTQLDLCANSINYGGAKMLTKLLIDNYTLLRFYVVDKEKNEIIGLRNSLLVKLLSKIKRASSFTFAVGVHNTPIGQLLPNILEFAGLNVQDRTKFENIQNYNNETIRNIIFTGSVEEVIRLFYYGNGADYGEILREVNQVRRLQREALREAHRRIPEGLEELLEEPTRSGFWTWFQNQRRDVPQLQRAQVATIFGSPAIL